MRRLNVAYQTLSDPVQRARYDEELTLEAARSQPARPAPAAGYGSGAAVRSATSSSGAGARPGAGGGTGAGPAAGGPSAGASAGTQPAYQTTTFDTRGDMVLPRSTVYVSVVMIVVIVVLIVMLLLDFLAGSPTTPTRILRPPAGLNGAPWSGDNR